MNRRRKIVNSMKKKMNDKKFEYSIMIKSIFKLYYEVLTECQESRKDVASVPLE